MAERNHGSWEQGLRGRSEWREQGRFRQPSREERRAEDERPVRPAGEEDWGEWQGRNRGSSWSFEPEGSGRDREQWRSDGNRGQRGRSGWTADQYEDRWRPTDESQERGQGGRFAGEYGSSGYGSSGYGSGGYGPSGERGYGPGSSSGYGRRYSGEYGGGSSHGGGYGTGASSGSSRTAAPYGAYRGFGGEEGRSYPFGGSPFQAGQGARSGQSLSAELQSYFGRGPKGYQRSDERIREDVCDRLTYDHELDASNIMVTVSNGEVQLTGEVEDRIDKRRAEDIVEGVSGVRDVRNHLQARRGILGGLVNRVTGKSDEGDNTGKGPSSRTDTSRQ